MFQDFSNFKPIKIRTKLPNDLIDILGDLHFRIDRLEMLLQELAENHEIDFNKADEAGEWIDAQMRILESKEYVKQLPTGL